MGEVETRLSMSMWLRFMMSKYIIGVKKMSYDALFSRNQGILMPDKQEKLRNAHLLIVGCGGVGGAVALSLARTGVGKFTLVEFATYSPSNITRQLYRQLETPPTP